MIWGIRKKTERVYDEIYIEYILKKREILFIDFINCYDLIFQLIYMNLLRVATILSHIFYIINHLQLIGSQI